MFVFDLACRMFSSICCQSSVEPGGVCLQSAIWEYLMCRPLPRWPVPRGDRLLVLSPPPGWPVLQGGLELDLCAWSAVTEDVGLARTMVLSRPLPMTGPERWVLWPRTPRRKRPAKVGSCSPTCPTLP